MFSAILSSFHWSAPDALAALHDRPWTAIRLAQTARKQGMREVRRDLICHDFFLSLFLSLVERRRHFFPLTN